ncbi:MAG: CDF family Co(II)/Ni(II) efflux transporter DmeF [Thiogranum sp.]|nr:CDF family Co(II)/Ni(II) efflux transporter DmeF [Thiogranum sp.]
MHFETLDELQHPHDFAVINTHGEKRTLQVLFLTAVTMVVEISAGVAFGSMALLADGWHMGTHVAAFMITIFAYRYARKHANNPAFAFGTGKVSVLGGFASAITLGVVALMMLVESLQRFFDPHAIHFNEAIAVATLGLIVNLISALLLKDHHHHHGHEEDDHDEHHHHDHNLRAAYMHVLADALTSVLAITALISGKYFGWVWMDPLMGIVGALVITRWAYGLVTETGPVLLDSSIETAYRAGITEKIETEADNRVADLHIWSVGPGHYAVILSVVTHHPQPPEHYKKLLSGFDQLSHITVEVNRCTTESCAT